MIIFTEEMLHDKTILHELIVEYSKDLETLITFKTSLESQPNIRFTNEIIFRYFELHKERHDAKLIVSDNTKVLMLDLVNHGILQIGDIVNTLQIQFENLQDES